MPSAPAGGSQRTGGSQRIRQRYDVVETVGRGGQGTVVKALDTRHDRFVALKIRRIPANPLEAERVLGEVRTLLELAPHPGLPVVRDDFFEHDQHVVVLDWVDGIDLGRVLATDGTPGLPPSTVLRWAAQAAEALTHLHRHDPPIVHCDVKPANLVLDRQGRIVCVDLGVSSLPGLVQRGGTPGYRAPELMVGDEPGPAADIYGLAATVFALLTGGPPTGVLPRWSGIEPARAEHLEVAIRRGLAIDPGRRPPTVGEFVEMLRAGEPDTLPTGTVTILTTRISRFATLWQTHGLAMPAALARHDLIVDRIVEHHGGRGIGAATHGETTVSVFTRAAQAVRAAVAINRDLVGTCDPVIEVCSGVHTGELSVIGGHPGLGERGGHGTTVNRAGEIRDLAGAGQVLLSATTAGLVAAEHLDGIGLVALGAHHLGGVGPPDHVVAVSAAGLDVPPDPAVAPYPGLASFEPEDADVYVGRDDAVVMLRQLVGPGRVVAVLGASGSGKSSLLRAGLLPHLPGATVCTPGAHPLQALDRLGDGVVIVDQLEELFTLCDDKDARRVFVERLCAHPAGVVVGLRGDALGELSRFPHFADAVASRHLLLAPMRPDQLRAAIEVPAERRGLRLEAGLAELVLADAGDEPGALPLVAQAMRETWLRRDGRTLTVAGYRAAGGVHGAIATSAEAVFGSLGDTDRQTVRAVLMRMVQPGEGTADSRRRVDLDELRDLGEHESIDRLVDRLAAARLVTVDGHTVAPAHESLLREWPRLADWIADQRDDLRRHRHLTAAAGAWTTASHDPAELYRGGRLAGAVELTDRVSLTVTETLFIEASVATHADEARRAGVVNRRLRRLLVSVAFALVVAMVAAVVAVVQLGRTSDQRDRADNASANADIARLGAEARTAAATQPDLALLLAVEANRRRDTVDTRSALLHALAAQPMLVAKLHGVESGFESLAWSPDATKLVAPTSDSTGTFTWDTATYRPTGEPLATGEEFQIDFDAAFTPSGSTVVVVGVAEQRTENEFASAAATLQVWDVTTRQQRASLPLGVLPERVIVIDDTHVAVAGYPISATRFSEEPDWVAAIQMVDIDRGVAEAVERVVDQPWAIGVAGTSLVVVSSNGMLTIRAVARAPGPVPGPDAAPGTTTAMDVDVSALLHAEALPTAIAYDPGGGRLAIGNELGEVVLAQLSREAIGSARVMPIRRFDLDGDVASAIAFSPDGSLIAVGGFLGSTRLFASATGRLAAPPLTGLAGEVNDVAFSPDGSHLAIAGSDRTGSVWSLDGSRSFGRPITGHSDAVVAVMALPDGETILTASFDGSVTAREVGTDTTRWHVETGEPIWTAALDATGTRIALGGADGRLAVLDVADGTTVGGPVRFDHPVEAVAWDPSGALVAVGADQASDRLTHDIIFLDAVTLEPVGDAVTTVGGSAIGLAFSPDGDRLAAVVDNNVVRLIDVEGRTLEAGYLESVDVPFFAVAWGPDGRRIATGTSGGTVQLWDADTLEPAAPAGEQSLYPVRGLAFNVDGSLLASTTEFATTQLWDTATGAPIGGSLVGGALPVTVAAIPEPDRPEIPFVPAFSPDGASLYVGSDAPMIWSLDPADWRAAACAVAGRELTPGEWDRYLPGQATRSTCSR